MLSPVLFNIYTNDQQVHNNTRSFIYANNLCIATQDASFENTKSTLSVELDNMGEYYARNHLPTNPEKTQTCVFHIGNRKANRKLNISWCGEKLEHTITPSCQGVILDRTLLLDRTLIYTYSHRKGKSEDCSKKLSYSKWGANTTTIRTTALALS